MGSGSSSITLEVLLSRQDTREITLENPLSSLDWNLALIHSRPPIPIRPDPPSIASSNCADLLALVPTDPIRFALIHSQIGWRRFREPALIHSHSKALESDSRPYERTLPGFGSALIYSQVDPAARPGPQPDIALIHSRRPPIRDTDAFPVHDPLPGSRLDFGSNPSRSTSESPRQHRSNYPYP